MRRDGGWGWQPAPCGSVTPETVVRAEQRSGDRATQGAPAVTLPASSRAERKGQGHMVRQRGHAGQSRDQGGAGHSDLVRSPGPGSHPRSNSESNQRSLEAGERHFRSVFSKYGSVPTWGDRQPGGDPGTWQPRRLWWGSGRRERGEPEAHSGGGIGEIWGGDNTYVGERPVNPRCCAHTGGSQSRWEQGRVEGR